MGHADYRRYKDARCTGSGPVIQDPLNPHKDTICTKCNGKWFCADSHCICRNTD